MNLKHIFVLFTLFCKLCIHSSSSPEKNIDIFWEQYYQGNFDEYQENSTDSASSQEGSPISSPSPQKTQLKTERSYVGILLMNS